jgi:hypothetical protein
MPADRETTEGTYALRLGPRGKQWVSLFSWPPTVNELPVIQLPQRPFSTPWTAFRENGACHGQRPGVDYELHCPHG